MRRYIMSNGQVYAPGARAGAAVVPTNLVVMRDGVYTRRADLLRKIHVEARLETPPFTAAHIRTLGPDQFGDGPINFGRFMEVAKTVFGERHASEADQLDEALGLFQTVYSEVLETLGLGTAGVRLFVVKMRVSMKAAGIPIE